MVIIREYYEKDGEQLPTKKVSRRAFSLGLTFQSTHRVQYTDNHRVSQCL